MLVFHMPKGWSLYRFLFSLVTTVYLEYQKILISVFLCLTVSLAPEAIWPFCKLQYFKFHPAEMQKYPQWDFLSVLFVVVSLEALHQVLHWASSLNKLVKNTKEIDYDRQMLLFLTKLYKWKIYFTLQPYLCYNLLYCNKITCMRSLKRLKL